MVEIHELKPGQRVRGLIAGGDVTIVAVEPHGDAIVNVVYRARRRPDLGPARSPPNRLDRR